MLYFTATLFKLPLPLSMLAAQVVHTTGVNWQGVLVTASAVTVMVGIIGAVLTRVFSRSVGAQIDKAIDTKVSPKLDSLTHSVSDLDRRTTRLEGIDEGRRQAVAAAGVTTHTAAD